jgi:hypothetical protein
MDSYEQVHDALQRAFGDTSIPPEETAVWLKVIIEHCEECLELLRADGVDC